MLINGSNADETSRFLHQLLDSLNSALLIVDKDVRIVYFNQHSLELFQRTEMDMTGQICGNGLGCVYVAESGMLCGTTPFCSGCIIRRSILSTLLENVPVTRQQVRMDLMVEGVKSPKTLQITSRYAVLNQEELVLLIIDDISEFSEQKEQLEILNNELDSANKLMHQQLQIAHTIQTELMPRNFPVSDRFQVAAIYKPFEELGGDYYDIYQFSPDNLSFYISDVSGHGVSSALITTMQKPLLSSYFKVDLSPEDILKRINNTLYSFLGDEGFFLTAIYGSIDFENMVLEYAIAAHPDMLLMGQDGSCRLLPGAKKDYIIGMFPALDYRVFRQELKHGDRLVIYTDGVIESANAAMEMFGVERLVNILDKNRHQTPEVVLKSVLHAVEEFSIKQNMDDDFTIMMIEIV